jgi:hypothetical protein
MKLKSNCCNSELVKSTVIDSFHGADDDYELKIHVMKCSGCGSYDLPTFSGEQQHREISKVS